jgi:hypothetical protein
MSKSDAVPAQPIEKLTDVYEVHGSGGWDFTVCTTMKEALETIESDLDSLEDGEDLRIVYRKYTAAQMEDVIYE